MGILKLFCIILILTQFGSLGHAGGITELFDLRGKLIKLFKSEELPDGIIKQELPTPPDVELAAIEEPIRKMGVKTLLSSEEIMHESCPSDPQRYYESMLKSLSQSLEFRYYKQACKGVTNETWLKRDDDPDYRGPGDMCILHSVNIASMLFDNDFMLASCIISTENGDVNLFPKHHLLNMFRGEEPKLNNSTIKPFAYGKGGNSLGQITSPAYNAVMEIIDPKSKNYDCKMRIKFRIFFDLLNQGKIPLNKTDLVKKSESVQELLGKMHPLMGLAISSIYLSSFSVKHPVAKNQLNALKKKNSDFTQSFIGGYDSILNVGKEGLKKENRINYLGSISVGYISTEDEDRNNKYRDKVKSCISQANDDYLASRHGLNLIADMNKVRRYAASDANEPEAGQ